MSQQLIPLQNAVPSFTQTVLLEDVNYRLRFDWNDRSSRWYFSLLDSTDDPIVAGICMVVGKPLLQGATTDIRCTPGDFFAVDTSGKAKEAGFNDLGVRVLLIYVPGSDLPTP